MFLVNQHQKYHYILTNLSLPFLSVLLFVDDFEFADALALAACAAGDCHPEVSTK